MANANDSNNSDHVKVKEEPDSGNGVSDDEESSTEDQSDFTTDEDESDCELEGEIKSEWEIKGEIKQEEYSSSEDEDEPGDEVPGDHEEPEGDKCPICLNALALGQDIGTPISCPETHHFCLDCIEEWSANVNTCPVDRKEFNVILVQRGLGGPIIERLSVVSRSPVLYEEDNLPPDHEDVTYCEICGRCDHEDTLLLCDNCDFGYHCHCLSPPLSSVPIEEWYCPDCSQTLFGARANAFSNSLVELNRLRRSRRARVIARTGASELVRSRIERRRTFPNENEGLSSTNLSSTIDAVASGSGTIPLPKATPRTVRAPVRRRKTRRKNGRSSSKRRKSSTGKRRSSKKTKGGRRKTKRCKSRRALASSRALPAPAAVVTRNSIIDKLGMQRKKLLGPHSLPLIRKPLQSNLESERTTAGVSSLSMFGRDMGSYGAVPTFHEGDFEQDDLLVSHANSNLISRTSRPFIRHGPNINMKSSLVVLPTAAARRTTDLLGSIMASQQILMTPSRHVTIARDGSLQLNKAHVRKRALGSGSDSSDSAAKSPRGNNSSDQNSSNSNRDHTKGAVTSTPPVANNSGTSPLRPLVPTGPEDFILAKPIPVSGLVDIKVKKSEEKKPSDNGNEIVDLSKNGDKSSVDVDIYSDIEENVEVDGLDRQVNELPAAAVPTVLFRPIASSVNEQSPASDSSSNDNNLVIDDFDGKPDKKELEISLIDTVKKEDEAINLKSNEDELTPDKVTTQQESSALVEVNVGVASAPVVPKKVVPPKVSPPKPHIPLSCLQLNKKRMEIKINFNLDNGNSTRTVATADSLQSNYSDAANDQNSSKSTESVTVASVAVDSSVGADKTVASCDEDHEDGEILDGKSTDKKKHRKLCKHGKPIKKKDKRDKSTDDTLKLVDDRHPRDVEEAEPQEEFPDLGVEKSASDLLAKEKHEAEVAENFKKLPSTSKNRSYRDGKPKEAEVLFREKDSHKNSTGSAKVKTEKERGSEKDRFSEKDRNGGRDRLKRSESDRKLSGNGSRRDERDDQRQKSPKRTRREEIDGNRSDRKSGREVTTASSEAVKLGDKEKKSSKHHKHSHHKHRKDHSTSSSSKRKSTDRTEPVGAHRSLKSSRSDSPSDKGKLDSKKSDKGLNPAKSTSVVEVVPKVSKDVLVDSDKMIVKVPVQRKIDQAASSRSQLVSSSSLKVIDPTGTLKESPAKELKKLSSRSATQFDIFVDENSKEKANKTSSTDKFSVSLAKTTGPRTPPELEVKSIVNNMSVSSPDQPTPTLDEFIEVGSLLGENTSSIRSPSSPPRPSGTKSPTDSDIYDPGAPIESPVERRRSSPPVKRPQQQHSISSNRRSPQPVPPPQVPAQLTPTAIVTNLLRSLIPAQMSSQLPPAAPPNTLLAQIQQTLSKQQRDRNEFQQKQIFDQLTQLLVVGGIRPPQTANTAHNQSNNQQLSSLQRAAELAQQGKLNFLGQDHVGAQKKLHQQQAYSGHPSGKRSHHKPLAKSSASTMGSVPSKQPTDQNDDVPSSAVELNNRERYMEKLHRQERANEEVKLALKPYYGKKEITKDEYKEIMRKAVPKICHSKTGVINPDRVRALIQVYIKKLKHQRRKSKGNSSQATANHRQANSPKPGPSSGAA